MHFGIKMITTYDIFYAVAITTDSLADGRADMPYSVQLEAVNGTGAKSWSDKDNSLAGTGLSLDAAGLLSGTPTDSGVITFTARATDMTGSAAEKELTITVTPAYICGDVNDDGNGPNLTDVTYFVNALFLGGPPIPVPEAANFSGDDQLSLTDVTLFVEFLFNSGSPISCSPVSP